jgi:hypothetical protein
MGVSGGFVVIGGLVVVGGMVGLVGGVVGVGAFRCGKNFETRASKEGWRERGGVVGLG